MPINDSENRDIVDSLRKNFQDETAITKIKNNRSKYMDSDSFSPIVELVLEGWSLEKYVGMFQAEDIGLNALIELDEQDFIDLGVHDAEDRRKFLRQIKEFNGGKNIESKRIFPDRVEDDMIMARNVFGHIVQLNSHASYIQFLLKKHKLQDYFISTHETALKIMKLVCEKAQTQTKRISDLLFDGNFKGGTNLIASVLQVNDSNMSHSIKKKLMQPKVTKKLKKKELLLTVVAGISLVCVAISLKKSLVGKI